MDGCVGKSADVRLGKYAYLVVGDLRQRRPATYPMQAESPVTETR